jgi:hypothetical protein
VVKVNCGRRARASAAEVVNVSYGGGYPVRRRRESTNYELNL